MFPADLLPSGPRVRGLLWGLKELMPALGMEGVGKSCTCKLACYKVYPDGNKDTLEPGAYAGLGTLGRRGQVGQEDFW